MLRDLRAIREADTAERGAFDTLSARALLLEGDRGSGKTSLLLTLTEHLLKGQEPGITVVCKPIEVRSLDRTDRVLTTLVQKLKGFAETDSPEKVRSKAPSWRRLESALVRSHDIYARFIAANAATEEELVGLLKLREMGTDDTRELVRAFVSELTNADGGHPDAQRRLLVFPLDDLDILGLRAWEAITDIDRYMSVPGLAFVFTGCEEALRLAVRRGLQREAGESAWAPEDLRAVRTEANKVLTKYFPFAERTQLNDWEPTSRLRFALPGGPPLRGILESLLDANLADLFTSSAPVHYPHAERLPATPRLLRSLSRTLSDIPDGQSLTPAVLTVQAILHENGQGSGWARWWRGVCQWVRDGGPDREAWLGDNRRPKRRLAEEMLGVLRQPYVREWAQPAIGQSLDFQRRYPGGFLPRVFSPGRAEVPDEAKEIDDAGWLEFFLDFALALAPELAVEVMIILGWDQIVAQRTYISVPPALRTELMARQRLVRWWVPADRYPDVVRRERLQLGGGNLHLLSVADIRRSSPDMAIFPPTVRGLLAYMRFYDFRSRDPELRIAHNSVTPNEAKSLDDLESRLDQLIEVHVRACLYAAGFETQPAGIGLDSFIDEKGRLKLFSDAFSYRLAEAAFSSVDLLADRKLAETRKKWKKAKQWLIPRTTRSR